MYVNQFVAENGINAEFKDFPTPEDTEAYATVIQLPNEPTSGQGSNRNQNHMTIDTRPALVSGARRRLLLHRVLADQTFPIRPRNTNSASSSSMRWIGGTPSIKS